ncbi:MAG: hypothetical protein ACHQJX_13205, partial [Candidatus Acidiferrales bacterium]
ACTIMPQTKLVARAAEAIAMVSVVIFLSSSKKRKGSQQIGSPQPANLLLKIMPQQWRPAYVPSSRPVLLFFSH